MGRTCLSLTCQDPSAEVKHLQAGGEGAEQEAAGGQKAPRHHRRPAGAAAPHQAADGSCTYRHAQTSRDHKNHSVMSDWRYSPHSMVLQSSRLWIQAVAA